DLDIDGSLLCLHDANHLTARDVLSRFDVPFDEGSILHVRAERGHLELVHVTSPKRARRRRCRRPGVLRPPRGAWRMAPELRRRKRARPERPIRRMIAP